MKDDFLISEALLEKFDVYGLAAKMASADWYYDYADDSQAWKKGQLQVSAIKYELEELCKLEKGASVASYLWDMYVPAYSVSRPPFANEQTILLPQKSNPMIEKNYDYLCNQLKMTGFGEDLKDQLKEQMTKNETQFALSLSKNYGNDETAVTLHFKRPDDSEMYFFNRYNMMLKNNLHPEAIKQTFYINPEGGNITMKEAYNMMCGRSVHKNLTSKDGEEYKAWLQLDFKETDKHGNYLTKQFHENYGFDLQAVLGKHPIKEMASETERSRLIESLERGNRQSVTIEIKGSGVKISIEASPQFKSLNFYESTGQRIRTDKLYEGNAQSQGEEAGKNKSQKQSSDEDEGESKGQSKKKNNRKSQGIS